MDRTDASRLGERLSQYGKRKRAEFAVERVAEAEPLESFHQWVDRKDLVAADLVRRDDGIALYILLIDWLDKGENWYCVVFPESRSGPIAEISRTEESGLGKSLVWPYIPKKHDERNEERKAYFERSIGGTTLWIALPTGVEDVARFLRDVFDLVDIRQRADRLDEDEPERRDEFPEGALVERIHRERERNSALVQEAKRQAASRTGKLVCQVCGFDFGKRYGKLGRGYIEAHHTRPLSELTEETVTRPEDIVLVCANCHSMLHRRRPWLTAKNLKRILAANSRL